MTQAPRTRLLVTGASGALGAVLASYAASRGHGVHGTFLTTESDQQGVSAHRLDLGVRHRVLTRPTACTDLSASSSMARLVVSGATPAVRSSRTRVMNPSSAASSAVARTQ